MGKKKAKRTTAKTIKINCKGSGLCELSRLKIIQGELKTLSPQNEVKLRKRIEKYGFDAPFFVWRNKILDGTQRKIVLEKMIEDGWKIPGGKVPVCQIKAENLNDAKQRLLGYVSQYGKVQSTGFREFIGNMDVPDVDLIDIPDFDVVGCLSDVPGKSNKEEGPECEFATELLEAQNYVVFVFDNVLDWQVVKSHFKLVKNPTCGSDFSA